jgi:hypothetical protein
MSVKILLVNVILYLCINKILSQIICYNPISNCFDPVSTQSLLFQANQYTKCSRTTPILQLNCIDENANTGLCSKYSKYIINIKCSNSGTDDSGNVIWKCESNLPSEIGLGVTTVSCEGCTNSSDKLKITGSCGIFYQLIDKSNGSNLPNTDSNTNSNINSHTMSGLEIFFCFLFGAMILICLIKLCVGEYDNYLPTHTNNSGKRSNSKNKLSDRSYIPIVSTERVIIPETIPLTSNLPQNNNPPPTNPVYQSIPVYQYQYQYQTQIRPPIYPKTQAQVEMTDTSGFLSGYLTGKNLEEGNIGAAYFTSGLTNSNKGNNFSTGMAIGMMEGSNHNSHSHHNHHKSHKKHHNNSYQNSPYNNDLESSSQYKKISFEQNQNFANSTTR